MYMIYVHIIYNMIYIYIICICSTDRERMGQVQAEMKRLLVNVELQAAVFLILANKQVFLAL